MQSLAIKQKYWSVINPNYHAYKITFVNSVFTEQTVLQDLMLHYSFLHPGLFLTNYMLYRKLNFTADFSVAQSMALSGPRCSPAHLCLRAGRKEVVGGSTLHFYQTPFSLQTPPEQHDQGNQTQNQPLSSVGVEHPTMYHCNQRKVRCVRN